MSQLVESFIITMERIIISINEQNLDNKLRQILAERQREGLLTVERVVTSDYDVKPPQKRGDIQRKSPRPEDFVSAVKFIVNHAAQQNDKMLNRIDNHVNGTYRFWLNANDWCEVMDRLLADNREVIEAALEHKQRADSVNLLAPYVGEIIGLKLFQLPQGIQKTDLLRSFTAYYGKSLSSVQSKLSTSYPDWTEFNALVDKTYKLAKKKNDKGKLT